MSRNMRGRLIALCLLACAFVTIGLVLAGALTRAPVAIVAR
jgi:hypothetical protein